MKEPAYQRIEMVRLQIERRGIGDRRVLAAMEKVPREAFVPDRLRHRAFDDCALPIDCGQSISQPFVVASMCAALQLRQPDVRVLEIGTGSGYAAAILAELAATVTTIERVEALALGAAKCLADLGYERIAVHCADGSLGWPADAPYDAILVSAGAPDVPSALKAQLREGGRLVLPAGSSRFEQRLVRITRENDDTFKEEQLGAVRFVPLIGEAGWPDEDPADRGGRFFP